MSDIEPGAFWVLGRPDVQARGALTLVPGKDPEVTLDSGLVDDPRVRRFAGGVAITGSAEDSVQAFLPITLHGQLDSGVIVSLLNARNHGGDGQFIFGPPRYVAETAVIGQHTDAGQLLTGLRFRIGHRHWLDHLRANDSVVIDDAATLSVEPSDDGNWLVYLPPQPATLRRLEIIAVSGVRTLMELALDQELPNEDIEVRRDGLWVQLRDDAFGTQTASIDFDSLLPSRVLTLECLGRWISLNDRLDGLAAAVARPIRGALQAETLVTTSLVEGIHRRLSFEQSKFPGLSKAARSAILASARGAAIREAHNQSVDEEGVTESVQFLTDLSFRTRASEIVDAVSLAIPEIGDSVRDLARHITKARNDFAHHLILDRENEPLEQEYLRWLTVTTTTPWLLRAFLLLRAGIPPDVVREGFLSSSRFQFARANVAQYVRELGYGNP